MQELEIERKNLLTKKEYDLLVKELGLAEVTPVTQVNHYFETPDFQLKAHGAALRIREKNKTFTLTLKQPQGDALLETHATLTHQEATHLIENQGQLKKPIIDALESLGVDLTQLTFGGTLKTHRLEIKQDHVLLVLDESHYLTYIDYELEIEGPTVAITEERLENLLSHFSISKKPTPNKIARFYAALEEKNAHA
ncbi:CYTH domain-containing protein [Halolactibacillus alkaliphilus]|uniref:CYTH domain-containing protein n=1 Tax=Halolactibacillus alkaliphilus TaxID=442899 RepID=A0A511X1I5_9BACI|nr:CYTH domain-containing protein [Halolactibacillus alkaliphilus]GEN56797.1 CYTH domain-containing protein [Halolactibacillus alkaliphilus]GGN71131.1 CYTH domain-containing protein [Halolactibacillus alkaliphilus]SFO81149.1 Uncharacterized protein YjbK [Halolactibacillus alkaliphilus]